MIVAGLGFLIFFAALFAQFPLAGELPGNADTWFAISLSNTYLNNLSELFGGSASGTAFFPSQNPIQFGESSPAVAMLYVTLRSLGLDDINSYYGLLCFLFAGTATGFFALARFYTGSASAAAFAALAFTCSNFTLANIDDCVIVFFGVAAASVCCLARFTRDGEQRWLYAAALLAGLQVYFSAYVFLFLSVWLGVLILDAGPGLWRAQAGAKSGLRAPWRHGIAAIAIYLALAAPFFAFYAYAMNAHEFVTVSFFDLLVTAVGSLDPGDLLRALPDNLIYPAGAPHLEADSAKLASYLYDPATLGATVSDPDFQTLVGSSAPAGDESFWISTRRRAHVGILLYALAGLAIWRGVPGRRGMLGLFAVGLFLAMGPLVTVFGRPFPTLLYPLNVALDFTNLLRVPSRAFFLCLAALCLLSAYAVDSLRQQLAFRWPRLAPAIPWLLCGVVLLENVPVPLQGFAGRAYAEPEPALLDFFDDAEAPPAVVLHLPSRTGFGYAGAANDLYELNREIIYMNWQTYHRQHTPNGVNGYLPRSRIEIQRAVERLPDDDALDELVRLLDEGWRGGAPVGRFYIAYHEDLVLPGESGELAQLKQMERLRAVHRGTHFTLFEVSR